MTTPFLPFYREIPLTQGYATIVDDDLFEELSQFKWQSKVDRNGRVYAMRSAIIGGKKTYIQMHRQILGLERGDPRKGDHRDPSQTLDNRRNNLRIATAAENSRNMRGHSKTGFKGVHPERNRFKALIYIKKRLINLGVFTTAEEAYSAYCKAAKENFGEFAQVSHMRQ